MGDLYSRDMKKPFLQRLATEAGIQFAPGFGEVTRIDNNTWKASAYAALRLPDGGLRTSNNYKVVDLVTEEKKAPYDIPGKGRTWYHGQKSCNSCIKKIRRQMEWRHIHYIRRRKGSVC